jgi:hypothetical protein
MVTKGGVAAPKETMIRVSSNFAEALKMAASFDRTSIARFADAVLLTPVRDHYREAVVREAGRLGSESDDRT